MNRRRDVCGLWCVTAFAGCLLIAPPGIGAADASPELQQALKEIEALRARLEDLERHVRQLTEPGVPVAPVTPPVEPVPPVADVSTPDLPPEPGRAVQWVRWNELMVGKSRLKLYGFLRLDAIYDDSRPNNTHVPAFIRSEDPAAPAAIAAPRNADSFTMHPKLTRVGLDFLGPEAKLPGSPQVSGKLEIDFYNQPTAESRQAPRLRHGYLRLAWDDFSLLAGQTADVISPIFPIVNPDFVMWGAGNLGDRRPQLRVEYQPAAGPGRAFVQGAIGLTGAVDNQDLDGNSYRDGESSGKPTLQARAGYRFPVWENQPLEVAVWGHRAWEATDAPVGASARTRFDSHAFGIDWTVPLYRQLLLLKGELWAGKNLTDVRGGILQGINTVTGEEIHSHGGWAELGLRPVTWHSLHGGYSFDNPRNRDLPPAGRSRNSIWYVGNRFHFDPIEIGFDYLHWTTRFAGYGPGQDNRFQSYISYKF